MTDHDIFIHVATSRRTDEAKVQGEENSADALRLGAQCLLAERLAAPKPNSMPAHQLWVELATRITCQRLHYRAGDEETAAKSVAGLFETVRKLLAAHPKATIFEALAMAMLNNIVRPYTARWHGWIKQERFNQESSRRAFRRELQDLQVKLAPFQDAFKALASGNALAEDTDAFLKAHAPPLPATKSADLGQPLAAGIGEQVAIAGTIGIAAINGSEQTAIRDRRKLLGRTHARDTDHELFDAAGLALSGGGIRSATFCLGIVQVLARRGMLEQLDYLSTVSGGGYFGSFLSCYLGTERQISAVAPGDSGTKTYSADKEDVRNRINDTFGLRGDRESDAARHLRNNSKYLLNGGLWGEATFLGLMVAGLFYSLLMVSPIPIGGALAAAALNAAGFWEPVLPDSTCTLLHNSPAGCLLLVIGLLTAIFWIFMPLVQAINKGAPPYSRGATVRGLWEEATLLLALLTLVVGALFLVPGLFHGYDGLLQFMGDKLDHAKSEQWLVWIAALGAFMMGPLAIRIQKSGVLKRVLSGLFLIAGPTLLLLIFLFVGTRLMAPDPAARSPATSSATAIAPQPGTGEAAQKLPQHSESVTHDQASDNKGTIAAKSPTPHWPWWQVLIGFAVLIIWGWFFVDINTLAPHRFYRARLCECYLAMRGHDDAGWLRQWLKRLLRWSSNDPVPDPQRIGTLQRLPLSQIGNTSAAPYHLINCTVNLPSSRDKNLRGRNGDFFLFSRNYCGSPMTGYFPTEAVEKLDRHLDLGTAMAISGAAASSNMGIKTMVSFRFLLTLANVRLGYWLRRPDAGPVPWWLEGVGPWYLLRELIGKMNERCRYLNISDGGHIENLAAYELLRRRCKFIICVDGGAEPQMQCADLLALQRYAAIDFGTRIELDVTDLRPNTDGFTRSHSILAKIVYQDAKPDKPAEVGWLLYLKLAVTSGEPDYVRDYRSRSADFPHETTADQFFSEDQFEAYRSLGETAMKNLFREELVGQHTSPSMDAWFQALANNLLPDNDAAFAPPRTATSAV